MGRLLFLVWNMGGDCYDDEEGCEDVCFFCLGVGLAMARVRMLDVRMNETLMKISIDGAFCN